MLYVETSVGNTLSVTRPSFPSLIPVNKTVLFKVKVFIISVQQEKNWFVL